MSSEGELFVREEVANAIPKYISKYLNNLILKEKIDYWYVNVPSEYYDIYRRGQIDNGETDIIVITNDGKDKKVGKVSWKVKHFIEQDDMSGERYVDVELKSVKVKLDKSKINKIIGDKK